MSCYLFASLFFLTLFSIRKKDKTLLWFGLFCASIFIRPFVTTNYHINTILPNLDWEIIVRIEYITLFLPSAFLILFINERFSEQSPSKVMKLLAAFSFIEVLGPVFFSASIFTYLIIPHKIISVIGMLLIVWAIVKALQKRVSGSLFAGIAVMCMLISATLSITNDNHITEFMPYLDTALQMGFLLSMSLILGSKFASEFLKVEYFQETTQNQKAELEHQHSVLKEKNDEITDSISYAYRIQNAILPHADFLRNFGRDSFLIYKPKDIVAGDFYWRNEEGDVLMFAAADCTGHGVPGAMVSVVCSTALNRSVREFNLKDPAEILNKTRELVIETFEKQNSNVKDGMDIALCGFNKKTKELKFSGANNALWIIRSKSRESKLDGAKAKITEQDDLQLLEFKGNRQPIGSYVKQSPFETVSLELSNSEMICLTTDGLIDQFGGEKTGGKKLMKKPLKRLILNNYNLTGEKQKEHINHFLKEWQGDFEQTDDICVLGLKV
ncbi:MAG: SpoIIE family protein phosphatase [Crocinitomicaceae bacterium]|nr:SpoIIE family protein phosphatase [Crocinitomicaceae bacterium]